ncbi:MAG: hypothetical protein JW841_16160 [Deltaproteobacteria bacterium]|nr:hypothetical protein [Deltaproteobacteria bacterium]
MIDWLARIEQGIKARWFELEYYKKFAFIVLVVANPILFAIHLSTVWDITPFLMALWAVVMLRVSYNVDRQDQASTIGILCRTWGWLWLAMTSWQLVARVYVYFTGFTRDIFRTVRPRALQIPLYGWAESFESLFLANT